MITVHDRKISGAGAPLSEARLDAQVGTFLKKLTRAGTIEAGDSTYAYTFSAEKTRALIDVGKESGMVARDFSYDPRRERVFGVSDENTDEYHIHLCVQGKQNGGCQHVGDINFVDIPSLPSAPRLAGGQTGLSWDELHAAAVDGAKMIA